MKYYKENVRLKDFIDTQKGYAFKSKWYTDEGIQIVKVSDFTSDSIDTSNLVSIPPDIADKYQKYKLTTDDVIVQTVGSWPSNPASVVGKVIKVPRNADNTLLNQNAVKLIPNGEIDNRYLFYLLKSPAFKEYIIGTAQGAASQASITLDSIRGFKFDLPIKSIQKEIASILSAFDDLIENNTRRIEILEEMARRIYREWFVHFRYPGHERDRLVGSGTELGEIPEGWEVRKLDDLCELILGQSPKSEFYNEKGEGLPFHQGVKDFGDRYPTTTTWCTKVKRVAEEGDILFSVRAPVGRINIANTKMMIGRGLHAIRSKFDNQVFVFHQLKDKFQEEDIMGGGTIFKSVTKKDMLNLKLLDPGKEVVRNFEEQAIPIFNQIKILTDKNKKLKETRDLLLPKLISGKVQMEEVNIN